MMAPLFSFVTFIYSLITIWKFKSFLSGNDQQLLDEESNGVIYPLWMNGSLVVLFILQHSWLKTNQIKGYLNTFNFNPSVARCIYVLCTSISLQVDFKT